MDEGAPAYLQAYAHIHTTLISGLNALPNLKTVWVTNEAYHTGVPPAYGLDPSYWSVNPLYSILRAHGFEI